MRLAKALVKYGRKIIPAGVTDMAAGVAWRWHHLYEQSLYRLTILHRRRLRHTVFVGVTGSAGKTTTKDLIASILQRHLGDGQKNPGSLNWPVDMVRMVLRTRQSDAYCVTEMSGHGPGAMDLPLALVRPTVGVVTHIGSDHFTAFKSCDAIAQEKGKLISALPADGVAVLNADDPRVLAMRSLFSGRSVTYGVSVDAMMRGDAIQSVWPERLSLRATWQGESVRVQTQLCGEHWASAVLAALASGVALGAPLAVAAQALASVEPFEGRMAPVIVDGITFIRDDWKAPLSTVAPAFEFMHQATAQRKVIIIGTISDYQGDSSRRYVEIAEMALAVADCVVFVGPRASASLRAKRNSRSDLRAFASLPDACAFLGSLLRPHDLVLLKGSHKADHLQRLIVARTSAVKCWRSDCARMQSCETCELLHVTSGTTTPAARSAVTPVAPELLPVISESSSEIRPPVMVIGLGNPDTDLADTPHNVGYRAVELLARRLAIDWVAEGGQALVARGELHRAKVCLVKSMSPMNEIGPALLRLAKDFPFHASQCILVHDDLDLPIGAVRARLRGGDGGHRGVSSILQAFQDDKFRRVKIGVGQPKEDQSVIDYVLKPFLPQFRSAVEAAQNTAVDRIEELIRQ